MWVGMSGWYTHLPVTDVYPCLLGVEPDAVDCVCVILCVVTQFLDDVSQVQIDYYWSTLRCGDTQLWPVMQRWEWELCMISLFMEWTLLIFCPSTNKNWKLYWNRFRFLKLSSLFEYFELLESIRYIFFLSFLFNICWKWTHLSEYVYERWLHPSGYYSDIRISDNLKNRHC